MCFTFYIAKIIILQNFFIEIIILLKLLKSIYIKQAEIVFSASYPYFVNDKSYNKLRKNETGPCMTSGVSWDYKNF